MEPALFLYHKYPKKLNPKFFQEGSSHYQMVERNRVDGVPKVSSLDLTLLVYDQEFLTEIRSSFPNSAFPLYKLIWKKRYGTYSIEEGEQRFTVDYESLSSGEVTANDLLTLLKTFSHAKEKTVSIRESKSFVLDGEQAFLEAESISIGPEHTFKWQNMPPKSDRENLKASFQSLNGNDLQFKTASEHYDFLQIQFESDTIQKNKLYYRPIFSEGGKEIYILPPLINQSPTLPKEPLGFERYGIFLYHEETK
ncbi:hypothetical protein LPTSP4_15560 [Leptospira ryugenii]|uniref:Uncharacterized protein n=1 Tax=Leptospira ryugenii TaxID=1917863 RepID=A0A2P2DZI4_9LEPT|nr:hypothetical protein [Leptospira ryugenii]GBF50035.1 hypothetical protein LPTSP4_15560 [Leptospira ryugenii]